MMGFDYGFLPDAGDAVKAKVRFGPLECTGQKELGQPGTSCASLRLIYDCFGNDFVKAFLYCFFSRSRGESVSGYYPILDSSSGDFEMVYCDMTRPATDANIQRNSGRFVLTTNDLPDPIEFEAVRTRDIYDDQGTVDFDSVPVNVGGGMSTNGSFTAPQSGRYRFDIAGQICHKIVSFTVRLNRVEKVAAFMDEISYDRRLVSVSFGLSLQANQTISLEVAGRGYRGRNLLVGASSLSPFTFYGRLLK